MYGLQNIISAPLTWFATIMNATDTFVIFTSAVTVFLIVKHIMMPYIGQHLNDDHYDDMHRISASKRVTPNGHTYGDYDEFFDLALRRSMK